MSFRIPLLSFASCETVYQTCTTSSFVSGIQAGFRRAGRSDPWPVLGHRRLVLSKHVRGISARYQKFSGRAWWPVGYTVRED